MFKITFFSNLIWECYSSVPLSRERETDRETKRKHELINYLVYCICIITDAKMIGCMQILPINDAQNVGKPRSGGTRMK